MNSSENKIFHPKFISLSSAEIESGLHADGFFVCEGAVRRGYLETVESELNARPIAFNVNDVSPVRWHNQTYFTHALAVSRAYFNLICDARMRAIYRRYLGDENRLKCQRYYTSGEQYELPWHTDNKTPLGERTCVRGIGVVIYLCDTYEGELQIVRGSHRWSYGTGRTEFKNEEVEGEHASEIRTISARVGSIIFFDSMAVHRTRKITIPGYVRRSIFMQIDCDMEHAERALVSPEFIAADDPLLHKFLGIGAPAGYPATPPSSLVSATDRDLLRLIAISARQIVRRRMDRVFGFLRFS